MRVLWLGHNLAYPPKGGVLQRNYNLLRQLAKTCEVHVLAFDQAATRPRRVTPEDCVRGLREFCASVDWLPLPGGIFRGNRYWLALQGLASREPYDFRWLRSAKMVERLERLLGTVQFDVVHVDTLGLAQYRPFIRNCAAILNHHNIESSMMVRRVSNAHRVLARHFFAREARKLCKAEQQWCSQFETNLVVSREDADLLKRAVPGVKTAVVANGVDTDYFTPRPDPGGKTLLFCGTLDWYANSDAMVFFFDSIWPRLSKRLKKVEAYVVGRNPPKWLQQLSAMDRRIHVTGFVEDVRPYFRKGTVYICPIRDGGGTRLKILDALAMGVPLIGTSFACSGLSLDNRKHVLLAETPDEFVDQIDQALSNAPLRMNLAAAGRRLVERMYSWNVIGESLIDAYEHACQVRCTLMTG